MRKACKTVRRVRWGIAMWGFRCDLEKIRVRQEASDYVPTIDSGRIPLSSKPNL